MSQDPGADFGATLRQARERCGLSLRDVSNATKISLPALEALERNDASRLPGGIFSRAFVRAFAREVGLNPEDAVKAFVASFPDQAPDGGDVPVRPAAREEARVDLGSGVMRAVGRVLSVIAVIGLIVGYLAWSGRLASWRGGTMTTAESLSPPAPAATAPSVPLPAPPPLEETVAVKPTDQPGAALIVGQAPGVAAVGSAQADATEPTANQARPPEEGMLRLGLAASGRCWVSLRSDGIHVFAGTMEAGDERTVDAKGRISLTVGDAGVFSYSINGTPARPMGGKGEVVTVVITAQNYKSFLQ